MQFRRWLVAFWRNLLPLASISVEIDGTSEKLVTCTKLCSVITQKTTILIFSDTETSNSTALFFLIEIQHKRMVKTDKPFK
jgi:hypothetical protein